MAVPGVGAIGVASAQTTPTAPFGGIASADTSRVRVEMPNFLVLEQFVDAGGPTAQANIESTGSSRSFASLPYPGDTVITLPGTVAISTGIQVPVTYPFFVSAEDPSRPSEQLDQPGYHLRSDATRTRATSEARGGEAADGASGGSVATASIDRADDGTVTAIAESSFVGLKIGPVEIAGFHAIAKVVRAPGGEPVRTSSMEIGRMTIAGLPVSLDTSGLSVLGHPLQLDLSPVASALRDAGLGLHYLKATENDEGVVAPGLEITRTQPLPNGPNAIVTITLGRASAAATSFATPAPAARATPSSSSELSDPSVPLATTGSRPAPSPPVPAVGSAATVSPAVPASVVRSPLRLTGWTLYPILLLAGAFLLAVGHSYRLSRVRSTWSF